MTIKAAKSEPRLRCPNCSFLGPQPVFDPSFREELLAELHKASGSGIDEAQLEGRTGDELLGIYRHLKNRRR